MARLISQMKMFDACGFRWPDNVTNKYDVKMSAICGFRWAKGITDISHGGV